VTDPACNMLAPPLAVRHADLTRLGADCRWASVCPACGEGTLGVIRDPDTLLLRMVDCCMPCAQHVVYEDIEDMRRRDAP